LFSRRELDIKLIRLVQRLQSDQGKPAVRWDRSTRKG
jgi:hypothetical protein